MLMKGESPMNRKSITVVVVVLLCAVAFGFSRGWFTRSSPGPEVESNKIKANQALDQKKMKVDAMQVTQQTAKPPASATK